MTVAAPGDPIRFTVVIPALNEADYLGQALRSLRAQDFRGGVEVIVVDNNSTDATAAVGARHGALVVPEPRPGVCWARQRGTAAARGEIIVSTDADTTHPADWLSSIDEQFRRDPGAVAVAGPCRYTGAPAWGALFPILVFGAVQLLYRLSGHVAYVTATNLAFRRAAWTGYDTTLTQGGDELDLLRRLRHAGRVVFDPAHPATTSARRLQRGLLYSLFVSFLLYYVLGYLVNRAFGRPLLPTAPPFRSERPGRNHRRPISVAAVAVAATAAAGSGGWLTDAAALVQRLARRR